jgi:exopolysaccharide production protein ExoQ
MKSSMANKETPSPYGAQSRPLQRLLPFAFFAFLFVTFVGLTPFAGHTQLDDLSETGEGDIVRQLTFIGLALLITYRTFFRRKSDLRMLPRLLPGPILLVLAWCAVTLLWSQVPLIGLRRLGLTALIIFTAFVFVQGLGSFRSLRLLALCLAAFVLASLVSGPLVPNAVHLAGERDMALIGAWRGIFPHKNHAGLAAALCVIMGFFLWRSERRTLWALAMAGGTALLILSKSKTSLGLLVPATFIGFYFELYFKRPHLRHLLQILLFAFLGVLGMAALLFFDSISELFEDPDNFTGRVVIWTTLSMMIADHPLGGVGFGSIYEVGTDSPLLDYAAGWLSILAHGHNGYLDIAASTGFVGLLLCLFAFIVRPLQLIARSRGLHPKMAGLMIACITFIVFHNFLESTLVNKERSAWVLLLIICAAAQAGSRKKLAYS